MSTNCACVTRPASPSGTPPTICRTSACFTEWPRSRSAYIQERCAHSTHGQTSRTCTRSTANITCHARSLHNKVLASTYTTNLHSRHAISSVVFPKHLCKLLQLLFRERLRHVVTCLQLYVQQYVDVRLCNDPPAAGATKRRRRQRKRDNCVRTLLRCCVSKCGLARNDVQAQSNEATSTSAPTRHTNSTNEEEAQDDSAQLQGNAQYDGTTKRSNSQPAS